MKSRLLFYPLIRREFTDMQELSGVINKSLSYCKARMSGRKEFTHKDKQLIARYLSVDVSEVKL